MTNHLYLIVGRRLEELGLNGVLDAEVRRNAIKEELQYFILNFIYHHPLYKEWTMYGGSALRICHRLNRMSVDLDFEIASVCDEDFLNNLKSELGLYLSETYNIDQNILTMKVTKGRGITLKFSLGKEFASGFASEQIHVKIDLNHFESENIVCERIPINRDQLSFVLKTYPIQTLMASKIVAIFQRGQRGVGRAIYEEKGRDIYDLLWYMNKHINPDLAYLASKGVIVNNVKSLFELLNPKIQKVNEVNLRQDLLPLFTDRTYIEHWLSQWRESYTKLTDSY